MTQKPLLGKMGVSTSGNLVSRHVVILFQVLIMADMANFKQVYSEKLTARSTLAANGICMEWTGATSRSMGGKYGVMNCLWQGKFRRFYVHRLALIFDRGYHLEDLEKGMDVGHLCHNSLCIHPLHLSYEPHQVNRIRSTCVRNGLCTGHFDRFPPCLLQLKM